MQLNLKQIRKHRSYSDEFKKELVALFESGKYSVLQLEKLYGIANINIYRWVYKFSNFNEPGFRVVESKVSHMDKLKEYEARIKELERALGRKQIELDYERKIVELAKSELNIDLKKNYDTYLSRTSKADKKS